MIPNICQQCGGDVLNGVHQCRRPLTLSPRMVFEWATDHKYEDLDEARKRTSNLGESASPDLCNAQRWVAQLMDWVATHMAVNSRVCFRCAHYVVYRRYDDFPLCEKCYKAVTKVDPKREAAEVKRAQETVAAVFAKASKPRLAHVTLCTERRIRHSYRIKTPVGYLRYDGTYTPHEHEADLWTRREVEIERSALGETSVTVTRVIR